MIVRHDGIVTGSCRELQSDLVSHDGTSAQGFDPPELYPALGLYLTRSGTGEKLFPPEYQSLERASRLVSHEAQ